MHPQYIPYSSTVDCIQTLLQGMEKRVPVQAGTVAANKKWDHASVKASLLQLNKYRDGTVPFDLGFDGAATAVEWWKRVDGPESRQLSFLARTILQVCPHAADTERTFSQMGLVHTPSRNRFEPQTVLSLVKIRQWQQQRVRYDSSLLISRGCLSSVEHFVDLRASSDVLHVQ